MLKKILKTKFYVPFIYDVLAKKLNATHKIKQKLKLPKIPLTYSS